MKLEEVAKRVHKAYCQYCIDVKGEEYWTKGDYSLLPEKVKEADRYTVRAVLKWILEEIVPKKKRGDNEYPYSWSWNDCVDEIERRLDEEGTG